MSTDLAARPRMSKFQVRTVIFSIALVVLDGYDVALTSFSAPYIQRGFGVSKTELGLVMSGALIGMLVGSILVAPIADRIGRRKVGVLGTVIIAIGMSIGLFANPEIGTGPLVASRIVTGVGVGALVSVIGVILSEYTGKKIYALVMAIYAAAINIGGLLGASFVGPMLDAHGWQLGWWVGFILSAVAAVAAFFLLPESLAWLAEGRRSDSLQRLNALRVRMNQEPLEELPNSKAPDVKSSGALRTIATGPLLWQTILMVLAYVAYMTSFYFMTNWGPTSVANANQAPALAPQLVVSFSLGGILGNVVFGMIGNRVNVRVLTPIFLVLATATLSFMGINGPAMPGAWWALFVASFFVCSGTAGFYAIIPTLYPTLARTTGYGIVTGFGRFGGIMAPILGGMAFDSGMTMGTAFTIFSLPMLASGIGLLILNAGLKRSARKESEQPVSA